MVENVDGMAYCSNDIENGDSHSPTQSQPLKVSSKVETKNYGEFVTLDNPLYDRDFVVILAEGNSHTSCESHPRALALVTIGVKKLDKSNGLSVG